MATAAQESNVSHIASQSDELQASFDEAMAELDKELRVQEELDILQSAIVLTEASWNTHAVYSRQDVGQRITSLEKMAESWKRAWGGMEYWAERRMMYVCGQFNRSEREDYDKHIEVGGLLLNGCRMLFSSVPLCTVPDDGRVIGFARRAVTTTAEVATGLERLKIHKYVSFT
jgi:hypothetical protein